MTTPNDNSEFRNALSGVCVITKRELASYFATPLAYVFLVIFLMMTGIFTFYVGQFFERGLADLESFFLYHPWLYLFLIPAISMRLWAEERKSGTFELLLTLPVPEWAAVAGKFLAAWLFTGLALALTFPIWITVNYLGDPDNGIIVASYLGSWLMAGAYLSIGSALSALARNQVVAFVLSVTVCFLFTVSGLPIVLEFVSGWAPEGLTNFVAKMSILERFSSIQKGVVEIRDLLYLVSVAVFWLFLNRVIIEAKKEAG